MKRICLIVCSLTIILISSYGQTTLKTKSPKTNYEFEKYSIKIEKFKISDKNLIYINGTNKFKTIIKDALKDTINFAGHCIFVFWGCGTSCQQSAIIDTKTKKVT